MTTVGRAYVLSAAIALAAMAGRMAWIDWADVILSFLADLLGLVKVAMALLFGLGAAAIALLLVSLPFLFCAFIIKRLLMALCGIGNNGDDAAPLPSAHRYPAVGANPSGQGSRPIWQ